METIEYRNLQFCGYAYGNSNVSLTAHVNGTTVFSGEVPTIDGPIPLVPMDLTDQSTLFSIENTTLFPISWKGSYPMSITVSGGYGIVLNNIKSNYMGIGGIPGTEVVLENSSITGNTLTIGSIRSGTIELGTILSGEGVADNTIILSGSDLVWKVSIDQTVPSTTITGKVIFIVPGNSNEYYPCFHGYPHNTDNSSEVLTDVMIDGVQQTLPRPRGPQGPFIIPERVWIVPTGSTIACNLNVSLGFSVATPWPDYPFPVQL